jgi:ATP-dependent Lon protease
MPATSAEGTVIRNYIDWVMAIPWAKEEPSEIDLEYTQQILDDEHYGLEKVKERIIEYLAVQKMVNSLRGPILCLGGPPGVGKTSLGKSIAKSLNRKFVRISLGGVRDEAEIRGHRRTYVGALPGRIIHAMKTAGVTNPVILLDEIDKMSHDFRGDPASALLEVLDPEQNHSFSDHYIEIPYDLSNVMFITTANVIQNIPRPLLDRMELITLSGYTELEKQKIVSRHLLPKQLQAHGLTKEQLSISEEAILKVIREYTREAGVRNLERQIGTICRKAAKMIVMGEKKKVSVTAKNLESFLGPQRFHYGVIEQEDQVGIVTGLAWTEVGGDILSVEVTVVPGKGKLTLTGKLGDVMKESAQAALSYIRSRAHELGISPDFTETKDIHIHFPEGAIPKDGPSAGITMATALASALSGRPVHRDVAMTGEITLRGRVLAIGGLKEKCLAAHRAGVKKILLPKDNEKDIPEIPDSVRRAITFVPVEHMDQVLAEALVASDMLPIVPEGAEDIHDSLHLN